MIRLKFAVVSIILILMFAPVYAQSGPEIGATTPNFFGRTLDGKLFRLSDLNGQPKVINFFLDTCLPCIKELPELAKLERRYPKVQFIIVHLEKKPEKDIAKFLETLEDYPKLVVIGNNRVAEAFKIHAIPHTVVVDDQNIIRLSLEGYTKENIRKLKNALQQMR